MTHRIGAKGQVVIPKAIREQLGIEAGDEVVFESDGTDVRIRRLADEEVRRAEAITALRGVWADTAGGGTAALEADRREEREREERKAQGWGVGRPR
jgi:AbrB family looped-hinge helix DNA binding protein